MNISLKKLKSQKNTAQYLLKSSKDSKDLNDAAYYEGFVKALDLIESGTMEHKSVPKPKSESAYLNMMMARARKDLREHDAKGDDSEYGRGYRQALVNQIAALEGLS